MKKLLKIAETIIILPVAIPLVLIVGAVEKICDWEEALAVKIRRWRMEKNL